MLDLMPAQAAWGPAAAGERCAVATVVGAGGSVPRPVRPSMLVSESGDVLGSLPAAASSAPSWPLPSWNPCSAAAGPGWSGFPRRRAAFPAQPCQNIPARGRDLVTPAEVAVSITAELVANRTRSARGLSLKHGNGPIHRHAGYGHTAAPPAGTLRARTLQILETPWT